MEEALKQAVNAIKLPRERKERIARSCANRKEQRSMNRSRKLTVAAAVLVLCLGIPLAASAAGNLGFMKDIKNWCGAITGQEYRQATNAIAVSAEVDGDSLLVTARFTTPKERPFPYIEDLTISDFKILDEKGFPQKADAQADKGRIADAAAIIHLPLRGLSAGRYTLKISAFTAGAKAEQPLPIYGDWECDFTIAP